MEYAHFFYILHISYHDFIKNLFLIGDMLISLIFFSHHDNLAHISSYRDEQGRTYV
jgi:hypothetical protein